MGDRTVWQLEEYANPAVWTSWKLLELEFNPDLILSGLFMVGEVGYMKHYQDIMTVYKHKGAKFTEVDGQVLQFKQWQNTCWATTTAKKIYKTECGQTDWQEVAAFPNVPWHIASLALVNGRMYIIGESYINYILPRRRWGTIYLAVEQQDGSFKVEKNIIGRNAQPYFLRVGPDQSLWLNTSVGLYVQTKQDDWKHVLP